ncbi:hypothetical protein AB0M44_41160 [Streptosporangium subroseum]|uniref:hypothetical protein n=1 Tax=Streptosporangium subroseum TaxID=106412 RepID=UPI003436F488
MAHQVGQAVQGVAGQRLGVLPSLPEHGFDVADGRTLDRGLDVVPRRAGAVHLGHGGGLRITLVSGVVAAAPAQVDPADEGDVALRLRPVPQHHEFLMVRATGRDTHVTQALPARGLDVLPEMAVLGLAEAQPVPVRAPQKPLHHDPAPRGRREHAGDLRAGAVQPLAGIAAPVGEQQQVSGAQFFDAGEQLGEVRRAVRDGPYRVAVRPGQPIVIPGIDPGRRVATLLTVKKPVFCIH